MRSSFDHAIKLTAVAAAVTVSSMSLLGCKEPAPAPVVSQAKPSPSVVATEPPPGDKAQPPASKRLAAPRDGASAPIRLPSDRMPNLPVT